MKRIAFWALATLFLAYAALSIALPTPTERKVSANSAQRYWEGVSSTGAIIKDENCPLEVQHEKLIFDIQHFPVYTSKEDFLSYTDSVSAEYTFYNPEDYTVNATLVFPFGKKPYWYEADSYSDTDKYDITVNGEKIDKTIRYTLSSFYSQFDIETDLPMLLDEYVTDEFYSPSLRVTHYQYEFSGMDEKYDSAYASFEHVSDASKTRIWFTESNASTILDDTVSMGGWVRNGTTFTVYVFGEPLSEMPKWTIYENRAQEKRIEGNIELVYNRSFTFEEFVFEEHFGAYSSENGISEVDWYNAVVFALNEGLDTRFGNIHHYYSLDFEYDFMRWYEYEIEVPPKSTIVNKVTAPIYPSIDEEYDPAIYRYTYLLSPAKTWSKFGKLDVEIKTPYYLINDENGFIKTETGYALSLDGLPDGELEFSLSSSEDPESIHNFFTSCGYGLLYVALIPISCVGGIFDGVGCSSVLLGNFGFFAPLFISATVLFMKKKK